MKNSIFFSFIYIILFSFKLFGQDLTNITTKDPLLVVVLMVKDEEPVIIRTLESYAIDQDIAFFIYDTGSKDNTISVSEDFFKKNNIKNWAIAQEEFIDFATSRNKALRLAEEKFPNACFLLMPDAEWYIHNMHELVNFCKEESCKKIPVYLMSIVSGNIHFTTPRLIRACQNVRFEGVVHESIYCSKEHKMPSSTYFEVGSSRYGIEKSRKRWERDAVLLLKFYKENPENSRNLFYLAQTYDCLGDLENAYKFYELRSKVRGWDEEDFMTIYRLAQVTDTLSTMPNDPEKWRLLAQDYYLKAYNFRPTRAEPLVKLAQSHLRQNNMGLAYLFARHASQIQFPEKDTLFVEPELYDFCPFDILGISCWYVDQDKIGIEALEKALKVRPDMPHLHRNLANFIDREKSRGQYICA